MDTCLGFLPSNFSESLHSNKTNYLFKISLRFFPLEHAPKYVPFVLGEGTKMTQIKYTTKNAKKVNGKNKIKQYL
jgi:hypothetical protein